MRFAPIVSLLVVVALLPAPRSPRRPLPSVVRGQVLSGVDSSPQAWASVLLEGRSVQLSQATDTTGWFRFTDVPAGSYRLTARALTYDPFQDSIRVAADTVTLTVILPARCQFDSATAMRDITRDRIRVFLHGSIAPTSDPSDPVVERMYGFKYHDFGDMIIQPGECDAQYHRVIFRYFDRKFGTRWRDSVRLH
jgi:hypothetical protein